MKQRSERSIRSYAPLTDEHLARLAAIADDDRAMFSRARPEYADRHVAVTLAQGAALHYLDGKNGVKDLDVWTFYADLPNQQWPAHRRGRHVDFGRSVLGRQLYDFSAAKNERERRQWERWSQEHRGRRVDLYVRPLPVSPAADTETVVAALREWLREGQRRGDRMAKPPTAWHLAKKAMIMIVPEPSRGLTVWPPG